MTRASTYKSINSCSWTRLIPVIHAVSGLSCKPDLLQGWWPCRPTWSSVWCMVWALEVWPPNSSTYAPILEALISIFQKSTFKYETWCIIQHDDSTSLVTLVMPFLSGTNLGKLLYDLGLNFIVHFHEVPCWTSSGQYERIVPFHNTNMVK